MLATRSSQGGAKHLPMSVNNIGFLLDRLGQDCHPLQFLRELTQNSIEAIERTKQPGLIIWDVDWITRDLADQSVFKLCVTDTGDGMTGEEMLRFINQLSSSASEQSFAGNFGVGAKIAAATRNPAGVIYQSWKDDDGNMIELRRHSDGGYGLAQFQRADGSAEYFFPIDNAVRPEIIKTHGTKVILMGTSADADTMAAPEGAPSPSRWISRYLNTRYFTFPANVSVRVREGWSFPRAEVDKNVLRTLTGQKSYLMEHARQHGVVDITKARVHWWILKDEPALKNNSGFIESSGHLAALYQDELYERYTSRAGSIRLQQFGITFGMHFVVLYVEPTGKPGVDVTTNTARTLLLLNQEPLPWEEWAAEFREKMPKVLADFIESMSPTGQSDHIHSIRERLKDILQLYKASRYLPTPNGQYEVDAESTARMAVAPDIAERGTGRQGSGAGDSTVGTSVPGRKQTSQGNVYHLFEKKGGVPADKVKGDPFPTTRWVSVKNGTRETGYIEDKAARYIRETNELHINQDFRVFQDMTDHFCELYEDAPGIRQPVEESVKQWFEQALVETVLGIQGLKSKEWTSKEVEMALSEEALTAAVMQRYHVAFAVKRELGSKLGKVTSK